jgi:aminoglycoside 6-adenylyltransferase
LDSDIRRDSLYAGYNKLCCKTSTYFDGNVENAWKSVIGMCELFENVAKFVGEKLGWEHNEKEGNVACNFLKYVNQLSNKAVCVR